jgi:hypothetical protein
VIVDGVFYGHGYGHGYPYNSRALTVIRKDQLRAKNISAVALRQDSLKGLDKISLSSQAPALRPTSNKVSVEGMQGNKVFLKKEPGKLRAAPERNLKPSSMKGPERVAPALTGEKAGQKSPPPAERRIRKKDSSPSQSSGQLRTSLRKDSFGYPSSPDVSIRRYSYERQGSGLSSIRNQFYRYLQGNKPSLKGSSSGGSTSRGRTTSSGSRGRVSSGSRGSSSGSRGSSGSHSGGVSKKH